MPWVWARRRLAAGLAPKLRGSAGPGGGEHLLLECCPHPGFLPGDVRESLETWLPRQRYSSLVLGDSSP